MTKNNVKNNSRKVPKSGAKKLSGLNENDDTSSKTACVPETEIKWENRAEAVGRR